MTRNDFDIILMLSSREQSKISFFNSKRKDYRCNKKEFVVGLKDSYERLGEVINGPHCYHINDEGLVYEPFLPKEKINKSIDFQISFELNIEGKSITIHFDQERMPYLKKSLEDYYQSISDKESEKTNTEVTSRSKDNYSKLFEALKPYISGISLPEFSNVINYKRLTPGTPRANWVGEKVDACYFSEYLKMTNKQWDNCFQFSDSKPIHNKYKDKFDKGSPVLDELEKFFPK